MTNPMTPTEQDKLIETILLILGITDRSIGNRPEQIATLEQVIEGYIAADRKRVALEAFDDGYEAGRKEKPPKLVDAVEFRRESYGWSKGKMAAMLDMTKGHYSEFVHEKRALPVNSIRKAYAIGIPAQVLLQDDINRRLKAQQEEE